MTWMQGAGAEGGSLHGGLDTSGFAVGKQQASAMDPATAQAVVSFATGNGRLPSSGALAGACRVMNKTGGWREGQLAQQRLREAQAVLIRYQLQQQQQQPAGTEWSH